MNKNNFEVVGYIFQSMDYNKFKMHPKNRNLNIANLRNIKNSMQKKNLFNPILVNEKFEIIDGNHRFKSCKELNLPILFMIVEGYDVSEMQTLNLNKSNWEHNDYLTLYVKENMSNYLKFKELKDKYNIHFSDLIHIVDTLSSSPIGEKQLFMLFDEGQFNIEQYDKVVNFLDELSIFNPFECRKNTGFVRAFLKLYTESFYDGKYLRHRIETKYDNLMTKGKKSTILEYGKYLAKEIYTCPQRGISVVYDEISERYYVLNNKRGRAKKVS